MPPVQRILSLDGGGIRGLITATWLDALQQQLKGKQIQQCFDLIAGTSTGSILACAIAGGKSPAEIIRLYQNYGGEIFPDGPERLWSSLTRTFSQGISKPKYSDDGLQTVLKDVFGDQKFGSLPVNTLVVSYDTVSRTPIIFKSWRSEYQDLPVWAVCKASCSAPTYFPAQVMEVADDAGGKHQRALIDGGVVANNPAACAVAEAIRLNKESGNNIPLDQLLLASFGTGQLTRRISADKAREWGAIEWAIPIIDVLFDGSTDAVDYLASHLLSQTNYYRMQVELTDAYDDLDDASKTNLAALVRIAQGKLSDPLFDRLAANLI